MMSFEMNDRKKIGLGLTGFGVFFSFLGIIFFFDKGLLAMGNILFFSGVTLTIGLKSSAQFFMKRSNFKGTVSFGVGFFLVIIGWPILGMIVEAYGFVVLFSGFWPTLAVFLQKMPIIGWLFQQPFVRSVMFLWHLFLLRSYFYLPSFMEFICFCYNLIIKLQVHERC
ncbi:vesicle transport protein GOT1-like isoform X1 [Salvia miltiorrhiza]|uniref:vesicle transport protein GOT1-like isoform X1 n=1 Tax=Salvia miltiorrhiza TaxID=226208 RepID=UPI0025AD244D|nr:vesicle transport protein GOT1-like isoform X1 [Salvia miltiorrhiza]XP_057765105.1 vesicle transport protein GOT1-like isoform X1 [Salvia miltiorrhiza]XP_057765114.1 vesicle transport protein GOT1-like isoform X1 [Salvia miltiorrhiza]